eukprot:TRINITY_DN13858_c0_g2_i4.p3 TRINITY_DN13858_c0_g2~~TRINITY_DN13858_c0_g2_i4.p3  ORF type:complete len:103 (+),score=4.12 TRINITY_DN13858_c0_g2_i4:677-985(+)
MCKQFKPIQHQRLEDIPSEAITRKQRTTGKRSSNIRTCDATIAALKIRPSLISSAATTQNVAVASAMGACGTSLRRIKVRYQRNGLVPYAAAPVIVKGAKED